MVVVVIIGILVAIAIPVYGGIQRKAAISAHQANVRTLQGAAALQIAQETSPGGVLLDKYIDGAMPIVPAILDAATPAYTCTIDATTFVITVTPAAH
ncbi:MAG: hypothetical protein KGZ63_05125 [Clostridiales bacterium]|jgi:type II secretory pathway pseudopilin PulG|nr:hypothetical protein [Clostridiales bacterium]